MRYLLVQPVQGFFYNLDKIVLTQKKNNLLIFRKSITKLNQMQPFIKKMQHNLYKWFESTYSKFAFRYYIDYLLLKKQCI